MRITTLIKKEFTEIWRDGRFMTLAVVISLLFVSALVVSWNYYQNLRQQHDTAQQVARHQWENQEAKNPHGAAHYGTYAFKPIYALSLIDNGLDKFLGNALFLEAHKQNFDRFKAIEDQNSLARFGELSPAFVLIYLLPLLIILVSFGSVSVEKERGMWPLMLSQGVAARQIVWGKVLGIGAVLGSLLLPFFLAGLLFLAISTGTEAEDFTRYGLICLSLLMYYAIFVNISVFISGRVQKSGTALVGLLAFWIVSILLIPRISVHVAEYLYPVPSLGAYQSALKEDLEKGVDGHNPFNEYSQQLETQTLKKYGVDSVQHLPFNWWGFVMQKGEEHERAVYDKHVNQL
ncbi:MAG: ABC transporter permease subunit, partial [Bacteroidia bacterium]|nr:ABC transporter permease subunit [Bacteroidia bacterium]